MAVQCGGNAEWWDNLVWGGGAAFKSVALEEVGSLAAKLNYTMGGLG